MRLHHLLAFLGIQVISWGAVSDVTGSISSNAEFFAENQTGPFDYFVLGGWLVVYSFIAVISAIALLEGRLQIFIAFGLLVFQALSPRLVEDLWAGLDGFSQVRPTSLELFVETWAPRLLFVTIFVSLVLLFVGAVRRFSQKTDRWISERSLALLGEPTISEQPTPATSMLSVAALLFSPLVPILGIILGYVALNDIAVSAGQKRGKDMAVAAIVIGATLIVLLAAFVLFAWFSGTLGALLILAAGT